MQASFFASLLAVAAVFGADRAQAQVYEAWTTCTTHSNGRSFTHSSADSWSASQSAVDACARNPSTYNFECRSNIRCSSETSYPEPTYPNPYPRYPNPYPSDPPSPYPDYPSTRPTFPYGAIVLSPTGRTSAHLRDCGGTVELNTRGGQVNIVFRNVYNCSKFDILSSQGYPINYGLKSLGGYDRARSGSFTLPRSVIDWGRNGVMVQVRSNTGAHADNIYLDFYAF